MTPEELPKTDLLAEPTCAPANTSVVEKLVGGIATDAAKVVNGMNGTKYVGSLSLFQRSPMSSNILRETKGVESAETRAANEFFQRYLAENVSAAEVMSEMKEDIDRFERYVPAVLVSKCIDGRTHGSKGKGYPPGIITSYRGEGNNVDLSASNTNFHDRVNSVLVDAEYNKELPMLYIALGHRGEKGHGCAAHKLNDTAALEGVRAQATAIREMYKGDPLYVLYGMTNTDDMSETYTFEDGTTFDTAAIISSLNIQDPTDIFQESFLHNPIDDIATDENIGHRTPGTLLSNGGSMYTELKTTIAMQTYLVQQITSIERNRKSNSILAPKVLDAICGILDNVEGLPPKLKAPLLYQFAWNIAYTLHQRKRMQTMDEVELHNHLEHAEELICYGEGFEYLPRNKAILAKPGRGNDAEALGICKKVLDANRAYWKEHGKEQTHPPLVHVNIEMTSDVTTWEDLSRKVLSRLRTMMRPLKEVFGDEPVRILTSYSVGKEKKFYPVHLAADHAEAQTREENPNLCFPIDLSHELRERNFSSSEIQLRQLQYTHAMKLAEKL